MLEKLKMGEDRDNTDKKVFLDLNENILKLAEYVEPQFDIENDVNEMIAGIQTQPKDEQSSLLKKFISNKIILSLTEWRSRYKQNDHVIKNIQNKISGEEKRAEYLRSEINRYEEKITSNHSRIFEIKESIKDYERIKADKVDLSKKFNLIFFIFVAIALAIVSGYKFAYANIQIENVQHATLGGKHLEGMDLYLKYFLYSMASFVVLATGKILATIYEKINFNKAFFLSIASLAVVLGVISAFYLAKDNVFLSDYQIAVSEKISLNDSLHNNDNGLLTEIEQSQNNINGAKASQEPDANETIKSETAKIAKNELKVKEIENKIKILEQKITKEGSDANELNGLTLLIVLISEMLVGAVTWMYAVDYSRYQDNDKRKHSIESFNAHLAQYEDETEYLNGELKKVQEELIVVMEELHRLNLIISKIKSIEEIEMIQSLIIDTESSKALAKLWRE